MEGGSETPPFWVQAGNTRRRPWRASAVFFNSGVLIALLLLTAALLLFFLVPSVLSLLAQTFKPNTVKRGWDSLNLVLVLFAIVCGFLSRNSGDAQTPVADRGASTSTPSLLRRRSLEGSTPCDWYKSPDRTPMMRRNSSSYPDLRNAPPWTVAAEYRWRFSDDTQVSEYRAWGSDGDHLRRRRSNLEVDGWYFAETPVSRRVQEDSSAAPPSNRFTAEKADYSANAGEIETREPEAPLSMLLPVEPRSPATPRSLKVRKRPKHSPDSHLRRDRARNPAKPVSNVGNFESIEAESPAPPPPPSESGSGQKRRKSYGKRVGSSSSTMEFFASFYNQKKRKKKQRQRSVDDFEAVLGFSPTPPPPPPPQSLFQNLFTSKKARGKRSRSIPPPVASTVNALKHENRGKTLAPSEPEPEPVFEHKPLRRTRSFASVGESVNSGGESPSPWIPIPPPPPPPPPFRVPEWKFAAVNSDFVRLRSPRCASPEADKSSQPSPTEESAAQLCPSPDVDTKADSFIARFRAGLKLEKVISMNEKQGELGLSGLGPRSAPPFPARSPGSAP